MYDRTAQQASFDYKFTGKERDAESGLDNFGARYNSSTMGRFLSPDSLGSGEHPQNPQSWNLYSYVQNNPLTFVDPTGQYVCGSTLNQEQCKNFQTNLDTAQAAANQVKDTKGEDSQEYQSAQRAIDAYGKAGVDNGVVIQQGDQGSGRGSAAPQPPDSGTDRHPETARPRHTPARPKTKPPAKRKTPRTPRQPEHLTLTRSRIVALARPET
jgi:RHS repeat-associated protein